MELHFRSLFLRKLFLPGFVRVDQFKEKCKKLYADKGVPCEDSTINKLAILLDFNNDGIIDFNEFIEGSRLVKENCEFSCNNYSIISKLTQVNRLIMSNCLKLVKLFSNYELTWHLMGLTECQL